MLIEVFWGCRGISQCIVHTTTWSRLAKTMTSRFHASHFQGASKTRIWLVGRPGTRARDDSLDLACHRFLPLVIAGLLLAIPMLETEPLNSSFSASSSCVSSYTHLKRSLSWRMALEIIGDTARSRHKCIYHTDRGRWSGSSMQQTRVSRETVSSQGCTIYTIRVSPSSSSSASE